MARRDPITAPPAAQPRYSLLVAAGANGTTAGAERWQNGVVWTPEACAPGAVAPAWCGVNLERNPPDQPGQAIADPFYVFSADQCSAQGFSQRDWQGRARRALEASQSFQVARELWTGALTLANLAGSKVDEATPFLASASLVVDQQMAPTRAIGALEQIAMECSQGRRLMIHVPISVLASLQDDSSYVLRDTGGVLTTAMGSIVVADAGYPGTGPVGPDPDNPNVPDDSVQWIYATQIVQVRLSDVELLPKTLTEAYDWAQAMNRPSNHITVWAQRLALYQLDPCCRVAMSTNLTANPTTTSIAA